MKNSPMFPSKILPKTLAFLIVISTFFPIFTSYFLLSILLLSSLMYGVKKYFHSFNLSFLIKICSRSLEYLKTGFTKYLILFALCLTVSSILSFFLNAGSQETLHWWLKPLTHYYLKLIIIWIVLNQGLKLFHNCIESEFHLDFLLSLFLALFFLYCIMQRYYGIDFSHGISARLPEHRMTQQIYRVSGFMGHPLTLAYNLTLTIVTWTAIFFSSVKNNVLRSNYLKLSIIFFLVAILYLSMSRWALFLTTGFGISCAYFHFSSKLRYLFFVLLLSMIIIALWADSGLISRFQELGNIQNEGRFVFWRAYLEVFWQSPWVGFGPQIPEALLAHIYASMNYYDKIYSAHNIFIQILANFGLLGFLGLMIFFRGCYCQLKSNMELLKVPRFFSLAFFAVMIGSGLMQNTLLDSEYIYCLFINFHLMSFLTKDFLGEML